MLPGEETGNAAAVLVILGIFPAADFLGQRGTALEKDHQEQGADDAPVDDSHTRTDGEDIEGRPGALFGKIVGMAAAGPKACGIETFVIRSGKILQLLPLVQHGPFLCLESPLLLIGNGFPDDEAQHKNCGQTVYPAEGNGR